MPEWLKSGITSLMWLIGSLPVSLLGFKDVAFAMICIGLVFGAICILEEN